VRSPGNTTSAVFFRLNPVTHIPKCGTPLGGLLAAGRSSDASINATPDFAGMPHHDSSPRILLPAASRIEGPGRLGLDMAFTKKIQFGETRSFTIRADAVNILNTPQWGNLNNDECTDRLLDRKFRNGRFHCIWNPKSEVFNWTVQSYISDLGFQMQESSTLKFEIS
jgi:hypothetical protein